MPPCALVTAHLRRSLKLPRIADRPPSLCGDGGGGQLSRRGKGDDLITVNASNLKISRLACHLTRCIDASIDSRVPPLSLLFPSLISLFALALSTLYHSLHESSRLCGKKYPPPTFHVTHHPLKFKATFSRLSQWQHICAAFLVVVSPQHLRTEDPRPAAAPTLPTPSTRHARAL